jgi:hypothetical protein
VPPSRGRDGLGVFGWMDNPVADNLSFPMGNGAEDKQNGKINVPSSIMKPILRRLNTK